MRLMIDGRLDWCDNIGPVNRLPCDVVAASWADGAPVLTGHRTHWWLVQHPGWVAWWWCGGSDEFSMPTVERPSVEKNREGGK